jgi:hypothetical protein
LLSPPYLFMWMDYELVATSFHEGPKDCFNEPFLSIQFSFRITIFSSFIDLTGITLSTHIQFICQNW